MDDKIAKLRVATDEAEVALKVCEERWVRVEQQLAVTKDTYRRLPMESQQSIQIQHTELPELIELALQAKNDYEAASVRFATNKRYLDLLLTKRSDNGAPSTSTVSTSSPPS